MPSREEQFLRLVDAARACRRCQGMDDRRRVLSDANGPRTARVVFIAEAPGRFGGERSGIPLTGDASGRNFCRYLTAAGLRREDVFVTNAIICNPQTSRGTNRPPTDTEVRNCSSWLRETLRLVDPEVVVTLGSKSLAALRRLEGHDYTLREHVALALPWQGRILFPLYHPSPQVAVSPTGRTHPEQERDYQALACLLTARGRSSGRSRDAGDQCGPIG